MEELMLLMSAAIPEDFLLDSLVDDIQEYKVTKDPATLHKIQTMCSLVLSKAAIEGAGGEAKGVAKIMKDFKDMERGREILNPKPN